MNKAFVREPEFDGRAYCPQCGSLGSQVTSTPLDRHIREEFRQRMGDSAWFCSYAQCAVAYFDLFASVVTADELRQPVYPKDPDAPICACFGFRVGSIEADVQDGTPTRIRELLEKSKSPDARCGELAADGQCCMREVQRLYMRRVAKPIE
ncbi:MAG: hypothetical protein CMJ64_02015 [Planctomycetaceae bacterium]|jgi:hypothetical protein|nr:hypothetical protein [Planctomycetaceae bacterium]